MSANTQTTMARRSGDQEAEEEEEEENDAKEAEKDEGQD